MSVYKRAVADERGALRVLGSVILAMALIACITLMTCESDPVMAQESETLYMHYEHLTMLSDLDTLHMYNGTACTLAVIPIDALFDGNDIDDTSWAEYLTGVNCFVLSLKLDLFGAGDSAKIDELWWNIHSESGLGPLINANGSSTIIGTPTDVYNFYGPFEALSDVTDGRCYPLRIPRGRGWLYIMAKQTTIEDTTKISHERTKARR